jgi:hypothetical protein
MSDLLTIIIIIVVVIVAIYFLKKLGGGGILGLPGKIIDTGEKVVDGIVDTGKTIIDVGKGIFGGGKSASAPACMYTQDQLLDMSIRKIGIIPGRSKDNCAKLKGFCVSDKEYKQTFHVKKNPIVKPELIGKEIILSEPIMSCRGLVAGGIVRGI